MVETIALAQVSVNVKYLREFLFDLQCRQVEPIYMGSTMCGWIILQPWLLLMARTSHMKV